MNQSERDRVLKSFKEGRSELLIATDVAARGLDIDTVTHVINFDMPWDVEQYIHRIGRTGRAGRTGDAITLIEPRERRNLKMIEQMIVLARIPTAADIAARRRETFVTAVRARLEADDFERQRSVVSDLLEEFDPVDVAAAALQMLWESRAPAGDESEEAIAADSEQPEAGMSRLFVPLGRQDGLRPGDLVGIIASKVGLTGKAVGTIDILDRAAFVEVPSDRVDEVIDALNRSKIRGRKVFVKIAHPNEGGRPPRRGA